MKLRDHLQVNFKFGFFMWSFIMFIWKYDNYKECQLYLQKGRLNNMETFIKLSWWQNLGMVWKDLCKRNIFCCAWAIYQRTPGCYDSVYGTYVTLPHLTGIYECSAVFTLVLSHNHGSQLPSKVSWGGKCSSPADFFELASTRQECHALTDVFLWHRSLFLCYQSFRNDFERQRFLE